MSEVRFYLDRWEHLKAERSAHETGWREVAGYIRPMRQEFRQIAAVARGKTAPEQSAYITDSTAFVALDNYVGGLYGFMSSPANRWFELSTGDDDLDQFNSVRVWLDETVTRILDSFGPGNSSFYTEAPELYADTPAFGSGVFYSEWRRGEGGFYDRCMPLIDCWPDVDHYGRVNGMYRRLTYTPVQAAKKFGIDALSERTRDKADKAKQDPIQFLHVVTPNDEYVPGKLGVRGFGYRDLYLETDAKHMCSVKGRREFPYQFPRWSGTGKYGYGLGHRSLPDVKTINAADRALLEATEFQARPAILAADEDVMETLRPIPRGVTYGGIDGQGRRKVDFLAPSGNLAIPYESVEIRRQSLRDAWMFSLMQVMGRTGMSPIETLERQEDRMRLMGPNMARMQVEFLSPLIARRFAELDRRGLLSEPPEELEGVSLKTEYTSPMARAQRSSEAQSALRFLEGTSSIAQMAPEVMDKIDPDAVVDVLAEGFSAPGRILRPKAMVEEIRAARAEQQEQAAQMEQEAQSAETAAKLSSAAAPFVEAENAA